MNNYWAQWPKSEIDAMHGVEDEDNNDEGIDVSDQDDNDDESSLDGSDCRFCDGNGCNTCLMIW